MDFFKQKTPSIRSRASTASDASSISGQSTRSSLSKSGSKLLKLKANELTGSFSTAAPNSRLLFASPPPLPTPPKGIVTTPLDAPAIVANRPRSIRGGDLGGSRNASRASLNEMESFEDSSASEESESDASADSEEEEEPSAPVAVVPLDESESDPEDSPASPVEPVLVNGKREKSWAALLAQEAMVRPVSARKRLGKPLHTLTPVDVALTEQQLKVDIKEIWTAMHLFMNSAMVAAEEICLAGADHKLYFSVGFSLITVVKSFATFEPEDLEAAIQCCKDSIVITQLLRKKDGMLASVGRLATGSTSVASVRDMNLVQRHAELIFAECTLLKAVVGILYSGDVFSFIKEALNMRNAYSIFRTLAKYVEGMDEAYTQKQASRSSVNKSSGASMRSRGSRREIVPDPAIDQDFRSGVFFGNGLISMILSLLPSSLLKIMEVFGFTGDIVYALETLMKGGLWTAGVKEPGMDPAQEGIRRQMCDLALLTYHLVIVSYLPVSGVDVPTAENILNYNLERYPNGVFFLYFSGRLNATQTLLEPAVSAYRLAIQAQREYIQLQHICHWDMGLVSLAAGDYANAYECYNILHKESNWSKAVYTYAKGVALYELGDDEQGAADNLRTVPSLMQRIIGKSVPLEKFAARRARKYLEQGQRLICPGIELAYVLNCLDMAPRFVLFETHLDQISDTLTELHAVKNVKKWGDGRVYWDDYCLAHLLRGIVLRFIAHPPSHTKPRPLKSPITPREANEQALISYNNVLKNGTKIQSDHHIVLFTHYELGRLYTSMGEYSKAAEHYELVLGGKCPELNPRRAKGKVSLQNMAVLRSNAGLVGLREAKLV